MNNDTQVINQDEIDLAELVLKIWNEKWIVLGSIVVSVLLGVGFLFFAHNQISAKIKIYPISSFEEDRYVEFNELVNTQKALNLSELNGKRLMNSFVDKLKERDFLVGLAKNVELLNPTDYQSEDEYNRDIVRLIYETKFIEPKNDEKNRKLEKTDFWEIVLRAYDEKKIQAFWQTVLKQGQETVRLDLERKVLGQISVAKSANQYELERLNLEKQNELLNYDQKITNRLAFLKEQSEIAKKLGIEKNTIESQSFSSVNSVVTAVKTDTPFYLRGYRAIDKEIQLLETRANREAFVPELLDLNKKIRWLEKDPIYKHAKTIFEKTPIYTKNAFKLAQVDTASIEMKKKFSPALVVLLSVVLGALLGVMLALFRQYIFVKASK